MRKLDLRDKRFGKLLVISRASSIKRHTHWFCQCDCGQTTTVATYNLTTNQTKSCGCLVSESTANRFTKNLSNRKFGKLIALLPTKQRDNSGNIMWECKCICGKVVHVSANSLITKNTQSCGCSRELSNNQSAVNMVYYEYQTRAKKKGLEFSLSKESFRNMITQECSYCGILPTKKRRKNNSMIVWNGIDRIDNTKGYISNNIVTCCQTCNTAKSTMTVKEFLEWAKRITNFSSVLKRGMLEGKVS